MVDRPRQGWPQGFARVGVTATTQIASLTSGKADKTSLATVALTGKWVDLVGAPPVATVVMTASSAARPTSDPSVRVIFYTPTPPVAVMLAGDVWEPTV